jgi:hypothetical protein
MMRKAMAISALLVSGWMALEAATVSGVVREKDSTGVVIPGAVVSVGIGGGNTLTDTTDALGAYQFTGLAVSANGRVFNVSKEGYNPVASGGVRVPMPDSAGTYTKDLYMVSDTIFTSLEGVVKDSASGTPMQGVKVLLVGRDSTVTDASGSFTLNFLVSGTNEITLSYPGYVTRSNLPVIVVSDTPLSEIYMLSPVYYNSIKGKITVDSLGGEGVGAATVILSLGSRTPLDTTLTDSLGFYFFDSVGSGSSYRVTASKAGFASANKSITKTSNIDTVNIAIVQNGIVNYTLIVKSAVDSSIIKSELITRIIGSARVKGMTDSSGVVCWDSIVISAMKSAVTLTASCSGYVSQAVVDTLFRNSVDTFPMYLVPASAGVKTVSGIIKDSVTSQPMNGAVVVLTITATGLTTLTFYDTTSADGLFSFTGIPVDRTAGRLAVMATGYSNNNRNIVVGTAGNADTLSQTMLMRLPATPVITSMKIHKENIAITLNQAGILQFQSIPLGSRLSLYGLNGKVYFSGLIGVTTGHISIPSLKYAGTQIISAKVVNNGAIVYRNSFAVMSR